SRLALNGLPCTMPPTPRNVGARKHFGGCLRAGQGGVTEMQGSSFFCAGPPAGCGPFMCSGGGGAGPYLPPQPHTIVGYPPGGTTDIVARLFGDWFSKRLGQQFIVENRPGAGNNLATEAVVKALPDGYTIILVNPANAINASLYKHINFVFLRDIDP